LRAIPSERARRIGRELENIAADNRIEWLIETQLGRIAVSERDPT
jgi:hypothetical protein